MPPEDRLFLEELRFALGNAAETYAELEEESAEWTRLNRTMPMGDAPEVFGPHLRQLRPIQRRIFQLVDAFLGYTAKASLLLNNTKKPHYQARSEHLRQILGLPVDFSAHPLGVRGLRNRWMHADEYLSDRLDKDARAGRARHYNLIRFVDSEDERASSEIHDQAQSDPTMSTVFPAGTHPRERRERVLRQIEVDTLRVFYLGKSFDTKVIADSAMEVLEAVQKLLDAGA